MSSGEIFCMSDTSLSLSFTYSLCVELLTELNRPIKRFLHISAISEEPVQPLTVLARGAFLLLMGKSAGADHIHAEHLIHASDRLTVLLSILCTSIMKHGYIPSGMLDTTLSPIVKTKTGDVTDKNNYRPIAVATSMSKVMELLILSKTECFLNTSDNQLGFKKKHGTDMCIHAFRQTIEYYKQNSSPVFLYVIWKQPKPLLA